MKIDRRTKREREIINQFKPTEKGVDCSFESLPNVVKEIAYRKIAMSNNESELVRHLDRCEELRIMTDTKDGEWVSEVDSIVRFFKFRIKQDNKGT